MKEILKLFKAFPIFSDKSTENSQIILEKTLSKGFIFSPEVLGNYEDVDALIKMVAEEYGMTAQEMNAAFHKSWNKVATATDEQLLIEQMIHYITTYGFQALGCYSDSSVFIPKEELDIPQIETLKLIVIKGYTYKQIKEKLMALLETGIALKEDTIKDIVAIFKQLQNENLEITVEDINKIRNKQVKIHLYDEFGVMPADPVEFLRFIVFKVTGETLVIKNKYLIDKMKFAEQGIENYFLNYSLTYGYERLSQIFLRYKPLFLALKQTKEMSRIVNKLRKLATHHHKPMPEDYLNSITKRIKQNQKIDEKVLVKELSKVNTFRKIRLAYALNFRMKTPQSILYRVRNGRSFATEFDFDKYDYEHLKQVENTLNIVRASIVSDLSNNVKDKRILIPSNTVYALPSTEKQFTGNMPTGSYIESDKDMVVGIHWYDIDTKRVDLDLSMINEEGKFGWDGDYRDADRNVLFSGDNTSAPKPRGASELFHVKKNQKVNFILNVNYYNWSSEEVPYKIIVAEDTPVSFGTNYMVDPNKVIGIAKSVIKNKQTICGYMESMADKNRFFFIQAELGKSITAGDNAFTTNARKYLADFYKDMISLNQLLVEAGAIVVSDTEDPTTSLALPIDVDLSLESLEKDTIINLLK